MSAVERTEIFEAERPRLVGIAARVLGDRAEAEDVVQQTWLRLHRAAERIDGEDIESLPAWLTTVTTRLCLDRLRARIPAPVPDVAVAGTAPDPAEDLVLADTVGAALQVVLDRLSPRERVAFVLHDSFGFEFTTIAGVLATTPAAARKLASRARAKVGQPAAEDALADWEVVDAFMAAARAGDFDRLLRLLAPGAVVTADEAALRAGTPARIEGRGEVAAFFDGSARAALPVLVDERPGAAWFHRGEAKVLFDFTVADGRVEAIVFRAEAAVLARVQRRDGGAGRGRAARSHLAADDRQGDEPPRTHQQHGEGDRR
ncbi:sigma-70 family RNA polymerase sigma factor [Nocardioides donggukensis]|uniref:sigma-70 family RNA polymerase sigma factor n=1 Tax=Nocardioides donggukensis TaxID=2774019 RepID=UPI00191F9D9E|nr:sigma-70 family RNA polymerase sigma factor [Nocardioides donggukensis]